MGTFNTHNSIISDSILEQVQNVFAIYSNEKYIPKNIPSQVENPPCKDCILTGWCKTSKEQCLAFKNYTVKGKYLDEDIGTKTHVKKHGLA